MKRTPRWRRSLLESKRFSQLRSQRGAARRGYYASASCALNTGPRLHEWRESRNGEEAARCQRPARSPAHDDVPRSTVTSRGSTERMYELRRWPLVDLSRGHWTKAGPTCRAHTYEEHELLIICRGYRVFTKYSPAWPLKGVLSARADRKKKKEVVIVRHYAVGSNGLGFRKFSSADGLRIIGEIVRYHLSLIILDISSMCSSDCDFRD